MIGFFRPARAVAAFLLIAGSAAVVRGEDTPSPAVIITERGSNSLTIADPKDQHIVARIPVGQGPHEIAVSTDGKLAAVSNYERDNSISIIDLKAQKELHRFTFSFMARPNSLAFVDGKFFVTCEDANIVARYDPAINTIDAVIGVGQITSHVLLYNPNDKSFVVSSRGSNTISFIEQAVSVYNNNKRPIWKVTTVPGTDGNEALDISPDGKELWTSQLRGGKVAILDLAGRKVIEKFEVPNLESDRLKFTRDGKRVLISDINSGNIVVFDAGTRKEIQRAKVGDGLEGISITPDGSTAYMASPRDNAVHIVDLKTMTVTGHISVKNPLSAVYVP